MAFGMNFDAYLSRFIAWNWTDYLTVSAVGALAAILLLSLLAKLFGEDDGAD